MTVPDPSIAGPGVEHDPDALRSGERRRDNDNRRRVLVTRPADQAQALMHGIRQLGLTPQLLPTLAIEAVALPRHVHLPQRGLAIFTSANAVRHAHRLAPLPWFGVAALAIGRATATALLQAGQPLLFAPAPPFDSEALIEALRRDSPGALAEGASVVTGQGGRGWIAARLRKDGHPVTQIEVYRRVLPPRDAASLDALLHPLPDMITSSSDAALDNLLLLAAERAAAVRHCPLIVNSERNRRHACDVGFDGAILVAREAGDRGQLEALQRWIEATGD